MKTLIDLLEQSVRSHPHKTAVKYKKNQSYHNVSYETLWNDINSLASFLIEIGCEKGETVAIFGASSYEWIVADFASQMIGCPNVPIFPTLTPGKISYILNHARPVVLFVQNAELLSKIDEIQGPVPEFKKIIMFDEYEKRSTQDTAVRERRQMIQGDDCASIVYTSGTTGDQKGVVLTHDNLVSNCQSSLSALGIQESDTNLSFLPFSHVYARMADGYVMLARSATIAFAESIDTIVRNFSEIRPTMFVSVPRLYEKVHGKILNTVHSGNYFGKILFYYSLHVSRKQHEDPSWLNGICYKILNRIVLKKVKSKFGGNIRFMVSGSGPINPRVIKFFRDIGIKITEGYGLTETSPILTVNRLDHIKIGTVGPAIKDVQIKIAPDGEILAKGPNVMTGYYENELATKAVFTDDGWLKTGDIGHLDEDGFLTITDRKKELLILSTGKNVAPAYVEGRLKNSRYIAQSIAIGHGLQYVTALIVPNFENLEQFAKRYEIEYSDTNELIRHPKVIQLYDREVARANRNMSNYEQIRKYKLLTKEFTINDDELSVLLKLRRRVIETKYRADIDELYK